MIFLQSAAPACVIDHQIQKQLTTMAVHSPCQFTKLLHARRSLIEFHQGRIDGRQIPAGIGTAKTPHPRVCGRRRIHGQQMKDSTIERFKNVRQLGFQISQTTTRRDHRVALVIQRCDSWIMIH